nr:hypothetical protein [Tanacetum cinerariifolium]
MENSKRGSIHMQEKVKLSKSQGASTPAELNRMQNVPYASAVGSIMYDVRCTRPDVANTKDMFLVYEEAEYIAAFDASKEAVWLRKFISGLGVVPIIEEPISMYCDNTEAIAIANELGITKAFTTLVFNKEFVPPFDMYRIIPWHLSRINQIIVWPNPKGNAR